MSFVKVNKPAGRRMASNTPELGINKNGQAFWNAAWLSAANIPIEHPDKPGEMNVVHFDIYLDEEEGRLAIHVTGKKDAEFIKQVYGRKQLSIYVKTMFHDKGYEYPIGHYELKKEKVKDIGTLWVADLGKLPKLTGKSNADKDLEKAKKSTIKSKKRNRKARATA